MSFLSRLLRRWGFIRLRDYGLVLTEDNRVIPAPELASTFEPPSWCSVGVPIGALPPPESMRPLTPAAFVREEPTMASAAPPPPASQAPSAAEPAEATPEPEPGPEPEQDTGADDEEWQWRMALARAKAAEQDEPEPVETTIDESAAHAHETTDVDERTVEDETAGSRSEPPRRATTGTSIGIGLGRNAPPKPTRDRHQTELERWRLPRKSSSARPVVVPMTRETAKPAPKPLRARGTDAPPLTRTRPASRSSAPPPPSRPPRPVTDATRPDIQVSDFADQDVTAENTIPSIPTLMEDTQVDLQVPREHAIKVARRRTLPSGEGSAPLPRLSAILNKRSAG